MALTCTKTGQYPTVYYQSRHSLVRRPGNIQLCIISHGTDLYEDRAISNCVLSVVGRSCILFIKGDKSQCVFLILVLTCTKRDCHYKCVPAVVVLVLTCTKRDYPTACFSSWRSPVRKGTLTRPVVVVTNYSKHETIALWLCYRHTHTCTARARWPCG